MKILTIEEAEKLAGRRLDRRRKYATTEDGKPCEWYDGALLFELARWTDSCSGCFESEDGHPVGIYPRDPKHRCYIGAGCDECGYTGKRRRAEWLPVTEEEEISS